MSWVTLGNGYQGQPSQSPIEWEYFPLNTNVCTGQLTPFSYIYTTLLMTILDMTDLSSNYYTGSTIPSF